VAQQLGHARFVPLGTSRKFWYDDTLSAEVRSITSPGATKRVYLDPHLLPLLTGQRVVLIDDVISTGQTALAPWQMLQALGADVVAFGVAMRQGERWKALLGSAKAQQVVAVFDSPLLALTEHGWCERKG
jgi:adenine/guanine phosphoribosyltransferase-like PRPP-binding protein